LSDIPSLFQQALLEQQYRNFSSAEQIYRDILRLNPEHADTLHQLGMIEFERCNYDAAIILVEQSLHLMPTQPNWWMNYGAILHAAGKVTEALSSYEKALIVNAGILLTAGQKDEALLSYEQALRMNPHNEGTRKALSALQETVSFDKEGKQFLAKLDMLSQRLFYSGLPNESAIIRAAHNELEKRNATPSLEGIKICSVKNPAEWAKDNGFKTIQVTLDIHSAIPKRVPEDIFPHLQKGIEKYLSTLDNDIQVIFTENVLLCLSSYGLRPSDPVYPYFYLFSSLNDIVIEEKFWLPFVVGREGSMFRAINADSSMMLIDFSKSRFKKITDDYRHVLFGNNINWGHWMLDFLPRIAVYDKLPGKRDLKLIFSLLTQNQRDCLNLLGIDDSQIVELDVFRNEVIRYHFDNLVYLPGVPRPGALSYLRRRFADAVDGSVPGPKPKLVYISRRQEAPRHRIANIDEVEICFENSGFCILENLGTMPTKDLVFKLSEARVIVLPFGAELGNIALCRDDAVVIALVPEAYILGTDVDLVNIQTTQYFFGSGLSTVFVLGKTLNPEDNSHDALAIYDLETLKRSIDRALVLGTEPSIGYSINGF
jgi:hypothetical protein